MVRHFYIVITHKKTNTDRIVVRRYATIDDINAQAKFIWSLFNWYERRSYRVMVQGELKGLQGFDSDCTDCIQS